VFCDFSNRILPAQGHFSPLRHAQTKITLNSGGWVNLCRTTGPVLVHCQAGLNRSSLVAARALMLDGRTAGDAIRTVREKRSPACLCNRAFEDYLHTCVDTGVAVEERRG
jgi:hypothetical protein